MKDARLLPPYCVGLRVVVDSATGLWVALQVYRADDGPVYIKPDQPDTWEDTRSGANSQWAPLWEPPPPPPRRMIGLRLLCSSRPGDYVLRLARLRRGAHDRPRHPRDSRSLMQVSSGRGNSGTRPRAFSSGCAIFVYAWTSQGGFRKWCRPEPWPSSQRDQQRAVASARISHKRETGSKG